MKEIVRIFAFALKELRTIFRQKRLIGTLVLGPFLILLLFGLGFEGGQPPIRTIVLLPDDPQFSDDIELFRDLFGGGSFEIVGVTRDAAHANDLLGSRVVDAVVKVPPDPFESVYGGSPAQVDVLVNQIDPVQSAWTDYNTFVAVSSLNREIVIEALREGQAPTARLAESAAYLEADAAALREDLSAGNALVAQARVERMRVNAGTTRAVAVAALRSLDSAGESLGARAAAQVGERITQRLDRIDDTLASIAAGLSSGDVSSQAQLDRAASLREETTGLREEADHIAAIPAEVLVSPMQAETVNMAPTSPTYLTFYAPAVVALLLQHLAVTLLSLSMVRERFLGAMEIFRVSPVSTPTIVIGKSLSYAMFGLVLGGLLVVLVNRALGVPALGEIGPLWVSLGALIFSSLGLGFLIGSVSRTENQAVQFAMLSLITSTFFGGFFIALDTLLPFAQVVSYLLPVTYGIRNLQDVMLRGVSPPPIFIFAPIALGVVWYVIGAIVFRRQLRPG